MMPSCLPKNIESFNSFRVGYKLPVVMWCNIAGSGLLLSVDRVRPAVWRGLGLRVWANRLRDYLASPAAHLTLFRATQTGLNATAGYCTVPLWPGVPVHGSDITSRLGQMCRPISDGVQQHPAWRHWSAAAAVGWRTCRVARIRLTV